MLSIHEHTKQIYRFVQVDMDNDRFVGLWDISTSEIISRNLCVFGYRNIYITVNFIMIESFFKCDFIFYTEIENFKNFTQLIRYKILNR